MRLTFDPEVHVYRVDGRVVRSVTQIIRDAGMGPDYAGVDESILERARWRGIHVDAACDYLDAGDLDWDSVHPPWRKYVEAWVQAKKQYGLTVLATQIMLYHPDLDYAGTADCWAMNGTAQRIEIDRKTSKSLHRSAYGLQTAAYAMPGILYAYPDGTLVKPESDAAPGRWIMQLKGTGKCERYVCPDPEDFADFAACVTEDAEDRLHARKLRYGEG